ncbi:MAG: hypothetical protein PHY44_04725 [Lachnospiraceae bacterium]|nr:hypothetical protein [Lachnospiraceae bacterium]
MYNRRYDRKTIILKQETDSFSKSTGQTAVAAIEIKNGKGRITLQGKAEEGQHIYLIGADRGSNICADLGQVGKTDFNPENVADSARSIENFDIVVLGSREVSGNFGWSVYVGFLNGRREWRKNIETMKNADGKVQKVEVVQKPQPKEELLTNAQEIQPKEEKIQEVVEISESEPLTEGEGFTQTQQLAIEPDGEEEITTEEVNPLAAKILEITTNPSDEQQGDIHDTFKRIVQSFNREMRNLEDIGVLSLSEIMSIQGDSGVEDTKEIEKASRKIETEQDYIFEHNEEMKPFNNEECKWVRICPEEIWALGLKDNKVNASSFVLYADKKYKHLLLGRRESGMLILGVPDCYKSSERRKALSMGFVDFFGIGDERLEEGKYGYWIKNLR